MIDLATIEKTNFDQVSKLVNEIIKTRDLAYTQKGIPDTWEIVDALYSFGINYRDFPGKKWWQFWLNDTEVMITNAIKSI